MSSILAESKNYIITYDYEEVYLNFKKNNRKIYIGDFYGDPQAAAISNDESFCVMAGCGLIIYYLHEPFNEYKYNMTTIQWKEFFRTKGKEYWIEDVEIVDNSTIIFTTEELHTQNGERFKLNVDSHEITNL